jgi:hypothetical protein
MTGRFSDEYFSDDRLIGLYETGCLINQLTGGNEQSSVEELPVNRLIELYETGCLIN